MNADQDCFSLSIGTRRLCVPRSLQQTRRRRDRVSCISGCSARCRRYEPTLRFGGGDAHHRAGTNHRLARRSFGKFARRRMHRDDTERVTLLKSDYAEIGPADARGLLQHRLEYRPSSAGEPDNDPQHFRRRGELFARRGQLAPQIGIGRRPSLRRRRDKPDLRRRNAARGPRPLLDCFTAPLHPASPKAVDHADFC